MQSPADLPAEIWTEIFVLAADEDILFQPGFPTSLAESAWSRDHRKSQLVVPSSEWNLRSPESAMDILQWRSVATKITIMSTCRRWRQIGFETLFRCLYFRHAVKIPLLRSVLDASSPYSSTATSSHGWWTRRIHIGPDIYPVSDPTSMEQLQENLTSLIRHCPNVEIFVVQRPLGSTFGIVIDTLATYASSRLHTISLNIPGESVSKIIWALNAIPHIVAAHIEVGTDVPPTQEVAYLGSAADLQLRLPYVQQISLRGYVGAFIEQLGGWELPSLRSFSIECTSLQDPQDVVEFLEQHGSNLILLDLNLENSVDVPLILDLCPNLSTFAFNADWRIISPPDVAMCIVNRPHQHITTIGLHGLTYAFGVGNRYAQVKSDSFGVNYASRSNDLNMSALNKHHFPKLQRIRALNQRMLEDLNESNGPSSENDGYHRWNRWWLMCTNAGIRLEDCTGQLLGTLPVDPLVESDESDEESDLEEVEDSQSEDDAETEESDEDDDDDDISPNEADGKWQSANSLQVPDVLTQLIQEVRAMNDTRDDR